MRRGRPLIYAGNSKENVVVDRVAALVATIDTGVKRATEPVGLEGGGGPKMNGDLMKIRDGH